MRLRFYFDFISSNAYLAWHRLPELARRFGLEVEPIPVLFAGLLEAHGQLGPAEVRPKALWMWRNNLRKAALLGIPLRMPRFHPFNPLLALRACSLPLEPDDRRGLIDALFRAVWVEGLHPSEPPVVASVAAAVGLRGEEIVAAAQQPEAKARLREQTDASVAAGVFGVPTLAVGSELFWGYDDLPYLESHLSGADPASLAEPISAASRPQPSAQRRRFRGGSQPGGPGQTA
jgi:2-hydroxychromene-2-carboxylate isomerase